MFMGKVIGSVWSTVKWPKVEGVKFLMVRPYHVSELKHAKKKKKEMEIVVVADRLGAGIGEDVICSYGHAARVAMDEISGKPGNPVTPIDAAVVAIVDRWNVEK